MPLMTPQLDGVWFLRARHAPNCEMVIGLINGLIIGLIIDLINGLITAGSNHRRE